MADERRARPADDPIEPTDEGMSPPSTEGGEDELLLGRSGRADIAGRLVEHDQDVGEYRAEDESLAPDYEYRVSASVSDQYGEYPYPGDEDMPAGYTTEDAVATEEGLAYFPPEDPATWPSDDRREGGLRMGSGFAASLRDAGYDDEDMPETVEGGDLELAEDVVVALRSASTVTGFRVAVRVVDAVVYVTGVVSTFDDIGRMVSVVHNVPGVADVVDDDLDVSDENIEGQRVVVSAQTEADGDLDDEDADLDDEDADMAGFTAES